MSGTIKGDVPAAGPYTMGQVAKLLGVNKSTLDRWERQGKIPKPKRVARTGERSYDDALVEQIQNWRKSGQRLVDKWEETEAARAKDRR